MKRIHDLSLQISRRLRREEGMALVLALGISLALGITATATISYSTHNETSAGHSRSDQLALALAEAGLNNALATLHAAADASDPNAVPPGSQAYEGGTAEWTGTLSGSIWTLTGTGRVPRGAHEVRRTVSSRVRLGSTLRS
ncbi:MAG TPA: hypothetical protein VM198_10065, partial [Longimicrobiales bacterium]|nr:hypothetical protein [Longimicrobiales bacterium]